MNVGDKGTIKRGKFRGSSATVLVAKENQVAVSVDGQSELIILDGSSFEPAPEPTIEVRAVREALAKVYLLARDSGDSRAMDAIGAVAGQLQINDIQQ